MRRSFLALTGALVTALLLLPSPAAAGGVTLHPSGFGEHSYAAWKAQEGLPDNTGNKDQFLYFQKETTTATVAAGVAVFKGVAGMNTSELDPLAFSYEIGGHCGAGAPRFNLRVEVAPGVRQTFFFGCNSGMAPAGPPIMDDQGDMWERRTTVAPLPAGEVVSLAIVYDEGQEFPPGHVFLDNIQVGARLWTSASDNGSGGTTTANTAVSIDEAVAILGEPLEIALT
jgi:hypothetical protein